MYILYICLVWWWCDENSCACTALSFSYISSDQVRRGKETVQQLRLCCLTPPWSLSIGPLLPWGLDVRNEKMCVGVILRVNCSHEDLVSSSPFTVDISLSCRWNDSGNTVIPALDYVLSLLKWLFKYIFEYTYSRTLNVFFLWLVFYIPLPSSFILLWNPWSKM